MDQESSAYIQQLIMQGEQAEAMKQLHTILRNDRNNADAWWLMANVVASPEQVKLALQHVLRIDPNHTQARAKLDKFQLPSDDEFLFDDLDDEPVFASDNRSLPTPPSANTLNPKLSSNWLPTRNDDPTFPFDDPIPKKAATQNRTKNYGWLGAFGLLGIAISKTLDKDSNRALWGAITFLIIIGLASLTFIASNLDTYDTNNNASSDTRPFLPAAAPLDGWDTYTGRDVQIQLPDTWIGYDLTGDVELSLSRAVREFPHLNETVAIVRERAALYNYMAIDQNPSSVGGYSNIFITSELLLINYSLEEYIDLNLWNTPSELNARRVENIDLGTYEAGVVEMTDVSSGNTVRLIAYVIIYNDRGWTLTYAADSNTFAQYRGIFEHSARSFRTHE